MTKEEINYIREEYKSEKDFEEILDAWESLAEEFGGKIELTTLKWLMTH